MSEVKVEPTIIIPELTVLSMHLVKISPEDVVKQIIQESSIKAELTGTTEDREGNLICFLNPEQKLEMKTPARFVWANIQVAFNKHFFGFEAELKNIARAKEFLMMRVTGKLSLSKIAKAMDITAPGVFGIEKRIKALVFRYFPNVEPYASISLKRR